MVLLIISLGESVCNKKIKVVFLLGNVLAGRVKIRFTVF